MTVPLSILDLAPVPSGTSAAEVLRRTIDLARLGEQCGYRRHWFAEHHGMPSVASSSPEVLIGHVAAATQTLRVGSGGIMLPNHAPLRIAEAFRTLAALHPDRIDLGIGRAPGSDLNASRALRASDGHDFAAQLSELLAFTSESGFPRGHPFANVVAMPDQVPLPPIWILGSSGASARLAGNAGMGYSFASHFSDAPAAPAFAAYRDSFVASPAFPQPHAILGVAVCCAATDELADQLATTLDLAWLRLRRGQFLPLPSPAEARSHDYSAADRRAVAEVRNRAIIGDPTKVCSRLRELAGDTGADEIMVVSNIHQHAARLDSYALLAEAWAEGNAG